MKRFFYSVITLWALILFMHEHAMAQYTDARSYYQKNKRYINAPAPVDPMIILKNVSNIADSLKIFIEDHPDCNQNIVFILNMRIVSGRKRFFVYDYTQRKIIDESLVAHGSSSDIIVAGVPQLQFGNAPGSYMTSLGKYLIGKSYMGEFGKSYMLYGLDKTNSNAAERNIVLHAYNNVPDKEQIYPIVESSGCPMVSPAFFKRLEKIIDSSSGKILLYICYDPFH